MSATIATRKKPVADRWTPVRRGDRYCSAACGAGCTVKDFEYVNLYGERLAEQCGAELGGAWTFEVWENCGWHFRVISPCGRVSVMREGHGETFSAGIAPPGEVYQEWGASAPTGPEAAREVVRVAGECMAAYGAGFLAPVFERDRLALEGAAA